MLLQNLIISQDSVNDDKVLIVNTFFKEGDEVKKGDLIIEYETSKAIMSIEAEQNGFVFYNCMAGDYVFIGTSVGEINNKKIKSKKVPNIVVGAPLNSLKTKDDVIQTLFSNKARKLLMQNEISEEVFYGVDLVNEEDVLLYISKHNNKKPKRTDINLDKPKCDISQANDIRKRIIIVCPSLIGMEVISDILEGQNNIDIIYKLTEQHNLQKAHNLIKEIIKNNQYSLLELITEFNEYLYNKFMKNKIRLEKYRDIILKLKSIERNIFLCPPDDLCISAFIASFYL